MISRPSVPIRLSGPSVPTIVARRPPQITGGGLTTCVLSRLTLLESIVSLALADGDVVENRVGLPHARRRNADRDRRGGAGGELVERADHPPPRERTRCVRGSSVQEVHAVRQHVDEAHGRGGVRSGVGEAERVRERLAGPRRVRRVALAHAEVDLRGECGGRERRAGKRAGQARDHGFQRSCFGSQVHSPQHDGRANVATVTTRAGTRARPSARRGGPRTPRAGRAGTQSATIRSDPA